MRSTMKLNELETRNRDSQNRNDPVTNHRLRDSRHHHPAHTTDNYQFNESTRSVQFWVENQVFCEIVTNFRLPVKTSNRKWRVWLETRDFQS